LLSGVLMGLGFLALIIPGIYLYGAWAVAVPALLLEDKRGRSALRRSRELVKGRWWPTAGVLVITSILTGVVGGVLGAMISVPINVFVDSEILHLIGTTIGQSVAALLTTPLAAAVIVVVYVDLRVRREGFDLELLARRLGIDSPSGPPPGDIFGPAALGALPAPPPQPWGASSSLPPPPPPPAPPPPPPAPPPPSDPAH
jgi:hypothetical protein